MNIGVGDVVLVDSLKQHFVVVYCKNHEDIGSMCDDRVYFVVQLSVIDGADNLIFDLKDAMPVKIQGPFSPHRLTPVEGEAPFEIKHVEAVKIVRRKVPKTITVYE